MRPRLARLADAAALAATWAQGALAAGWLAVAPKGFPLGSLRFVTNTALPALAMALVLGATAAWARGRRGPGRAVCAGLGALWLGLALGLLVAFPVSAPHVAGPLAAAGVVAALLGVRREAASLAALLVGAAAGALVAASLRPAPPSTHPLGAAAEPAGVAEAISVECGGLEVTLDPAMRLGPASPDGFWPILGLASAPEVIARADVTHDGGATRVEATSRLASPAMVHLASFAELQAKGRGPLTLSFSAAPGAVLTPQPSDYPRGRPLRLAYVGEDRAFVVAEATSGEKGPFHELARGALPPEAPLAITLLEGGRPACKVTFADFAAQLSTAPSPAAGWGLPVNAIEFARLGDAEDAPVAVLLELAATGVGLGWDAVGTAAGTYRNRVSLEPLR